MIDEDALVEKSKPLIWARFKDWTNGELNLFDTYLSRINARNLESAEVTFTLDEYAQLTGIDRSRPELVNRYVKKFLSNVMSINLKDGWVNFPLFQYARVEKSDSGDWTVTLRCNQNLDKAFFQLAESGYQSYRLKYSLSLNSKYAKLIYFLLKDNKFRGVWKIDLDDLRTQIGATDPSYMAFKEFNRTVLKPSIQAINDVTDLYVEATPIRQSKKVSAISFLIRDKKEPIYEADASDASEGKRKGRRKKISLDEPKTPTEELPEELIPIQKVLPPSFSSADIMLIFDLAKKKNEEELKGKSEEAAIEYIAEWLRSRTLYMAAQKRPVESPVGWLTQCIVQGWAPEDRKPKKWTDQYSKSELRMPDKNLFAQDWNAVFGDEDKEEKQEKKE